MHKKCPAVFGNFFTLLKFLQFCYQNLQPTVKCVVDSEKNPSYDKRFFRAVQRIAQTSRGCDATASEGNLKYRARHCHIFFLLQI